VSHPILQRTVLAFSVASHHPIFFKQTCGELILKTAHHDLTVSRMDLTKLNAKMTDHAPLVEINPKEVTHATPIFLPVRAEQVTPSFWATCGDFNVVNH
jgi:hypothetical protein